MARKDAEEGALEMDNIGLTRWTGQPELTSSRSRPRLFGSSSSSSLNLHSDTNFPLSKIPSHPESSSSLPRPASHPSVIIEEPEPSSSSSSSASSPLPSSSSSPPPSSPTAHAAPSGNLKDGTSID